MATNCEMNNIDLKRSTLKIQFRSVRYADDCRVIEYRVHPDQDITYKKTVNKLFGLGTKVITYEYTTRWVRPGVYHYYKTFNELRSVPIWTSEHDWKIRKLAWFKAHFNTIGEFETWIDEQDKKAKAEAEEYAEKVEPDIIY